MRKKQRGVEEETEVWPKSAVQRIARSVRRVPRLLAGEPHCFASSH